MKNKFYTILIAAFFSLASCSSDDSGTQTNNQQQEQEQPTPEKEYKLFLYQNNIDKSYLTFETKTGNGDWVERELNPLRFIVKLGDSVRVTSGTHYLEGKTINVSLQLNTVVDWYDERNKNFHVQSYDRPLDKKFKVEL